MITDQSPIEGAMLIQPGDLFGLLDILELAEQGHIRRDALFATSPDGIIIELSSTYSSSTGSKKRRGPRSRSRSIESGEARKKVRRSSVASTSSLSSCSTSSDADSASVISSTSSRTSCASCLSTTTTQSKPTSCTAPSTSTSSSLTTSSSSPTSAPPSKTSPKPTQPTKTAPPNPSTFTYYSPTTHQATTIDKTRPETVPSSVANEAISALIGKLDDIMAAKAGATLRSIGGSGELGGRGAGGLNSRGRGVGVC